MSRVSGLKTSQDMAYAAGHEINYEGRLKFYNIGRMNEREEEEGRGKDGSFLFCKFCE